MFDLITTLVRLKIWKLFYSFKVQQGVHCFLLHLVVTQIHFPSKFGPPLCDGDGCNCYRKDRKVSSDEVSHSVPVQVTLLKVDLVTGILTLCIKNILLRVYCISNFPSTKVLKCGQDSKEMTNWRSTWEMHVLWEKSENGNWRWKGSQSAQPPPTPLSVYISTYGQKTANVLPW